ncbi:MAG: hypothetical protein KC561_17930, partial [Myxococcales bacterium]|nr:hypothetical protein [Myxococcales bacterium]
DTGRPEEAVAALMALVEESPEDRYVRLEVAQLLYEAGFVEEALSEYQFVADSTRSNTRDRADALREVALLERELGRYDDSIRTWEQIQSLVRPDHWIYREAERGLVDTYRSAGRLDELRQLLDEQLERRPADSSTRLTRARVNADLGRFDEAVADYRFLIDAGPTIVTPFAELASLLEAAGRAGDVESVWREALERWPRDTTIVFRLADFLIGTGYSHEASFLLREHMNQSWDDAGELWQFLERFGRIEDLRSIERLALRLEQLDSNNVRARLVLLKHAVRHADIESAEQQLGVLIDHGDAQTLYEAYEVFEENDLAELANHALGAGFAADPSDTELGIAMASRRTANPSEALANMRRVLMAPSSDEAALAAFESYSVILESLGTLDSVAQSQLAEYYASRDASAGRLALLLALSGGDESEATGVAMCLMSDGVNVESLLMRFASLRADQASLNVHRRLFAPSGPVDARTAILQAEVHLSAGSRSRAIRELTEVVENNSDRADVLNAV